MIPTFTNLDHPPDRVNPDSRGPFEGPGGLSVLGDHPWLVLGGGGLKGLGHVGVWRGLEEVGFRPRGIVGTSIGALVGAGLAAGMGWADLAPRALTLRKEDLVRINRRVLWVNGIRAESVFQADPLRNYIRSVLPVHRWEDLSLPLQVNAVDLSTGDTHWFGIGARTDVALVDAVYASCALPVLYPPARLGGGWFVDGGAVDALPLRRPEALGASGVLAIDVGSGGTVDGEGTVAGGVVSIHSRVFSLMSGRRRRDAIAGWEGMRLRLVRPQLDGYGSFDFQHAAYYLEEGYRATLGALHRWGVPVRPRAVDPGTPEEPDGLAPTPGTGEATEGEGPGG